MTKVLVLYGSTTGNTEDVADAVSQILSSGCDVSTKNVSEVSASGLTDEFDAVIFGSSTWGTDEIKLQDDFEEFFEDFDELNLKDKKVAAFGCGDSSFEYFCGAVDLISEKATELGAKVILDGLKIDGTLNDAEDEVNSWANTILQKLS